MLVQRLSWREAFENSVRFAGISLKEAISLATLQPTRLLGIKNEIGSTGSDTALNLILFEWDDATCEMDLIATILNGQVVYQRK